jgi:hypothetical protein
VLRVSISDGDPQLPAVGQSPDLAAEGGRGVLVVSTLASRWGLEALPSGGKAVWFELDVGSGLKSH